MDNFFKDTRPGKEITHGSAFFELPILYQRDDAFGLYFSVNAKKLAGILPTEKLYPIILPNGRAVFAICAFNYIDTTIGTYGEVAAVIPVIYGKKPLTGMLPALMESNYPGFGALVHHLPVTNAEARDAGRGEWGYPKFIADMHFNIKTDYLECLMREKQAHILDLRVARKGIFLSDKKPLITFSVKENKLIKTVVPQKGIRRIALNPKNSYVKFGDHPMAESIKALDISDRPFMSFYFPERAAILPSGEIIDSNVKTFEGYMGETRIAEHTIDYS